MRISRAVSRNGILAMAASVLLSGSALAAATVPAEAAPAPATVKVTPIPDQTTDPLSAPIVPVAITATDTNAAGLPLTFTATDNPATATGLPPGLAITAAGAEGATITGTITAPYTGTVTITAKDANGVTGDTSFTWTANNTIQVANPGNQANQVGTAITPLPITASDNDAAALPLTFTATDNPATVTGLPPGLAITSGGAEEATISGTSTAPYKGTVTITATDASGATGDTKFTWDVSQNKIIIKAPTSKTVWPGVPVSLRLTATDFAAGQKLTWTTSGLPRGLSINAASGLISGKPTQPGPKTTVVTATDKTGSAGHATIKWNVAVPIIIPDPGPQTTTVGQWIALAPIIYRDAVPGDKVKFSATGLPAGMGLQQKPLMLYGWPVSAGTYNVTIWGKGSSGSIDNMKFKLVVKPAPDKGATSQIRLRLGGKCLQDPGNRTSNGTRVAIANCVSGGTERWTVASDNTVRVNGRCLDIAGTGGAFGKQVQLWSCTGAARETWLQGTAGELINPASGLCLTDPGSSTRNGTVPTMGTCHVRSYEQWTLPAQPVLTSLGGSCADDHYSGGANGNVIDMFWCNGSRGQAWTFEPDGTIRAGLYGGQCVTARRGKIVLWTCSARNSAQKWTVVGTGGLSSELRVGNACLAIKSLTAANGTQLITARCTASDPRVHWHIW